MFPLPSGAIGCDNMIDLKLTIEEERLVDRVIKAVRDQKPEYGMLPFQVYFQHGEMVRVEFERPIVESMKL